MLRDSNQQVVPGKQRTSHWLWLGPLLYMLVVALYFICRYTGLWAEGDSATFTNAIRAVARAGQLVPTEGIIYPNGYAYQAISTFILALTGLDVVTLQQFVYPLAAALVIIPAWLLYREVTGSERGATITTVLLFTQPELLFVILRSSHEKFTRTLMLLCLLLLVRSFKLRDRPWLFATHVGLFYLVTFAFITSNNLLAHSFIFAVAIALVAGQVLGQRNPGLQQQNHVAFKRLLYVTLVSLVLVYLFIFYFYPPALHDLSFLRSLWERVASLFLDVETPASPYTQAVAAWTQQSLSVYFVVSIANWLILVTSFIVWVVQGLRWLWRREMPHLQTDWLLWLLYAAFAFQEVLSIVADASGGLTNNLQLRLFPSFSTIAVALVGITLARWKPVRTSTLIASVIPAHRLAVRNGERASLRSNLHQPRPFARPVRWGLTLAVFCIAILSVTKATNEPMLSNKWVFYRPYELSALQWTDAHLNNAEVWTEYDERLEVAMQTTQETSANGNHLTIGPLQDTTRNILMTDVTLLRSSRLNQPLPVPPDAERVYDNGAAQLYHLRPQSPYQP